MVGKHGEVWARRVVTGLDENGKSTIVSDDLTETRLVADAFTLNHLWKASKVPDDCLQENTLGTEVLIPPPPAGFTYLISTFPPDSEWDFEGGYAGSLSDAGAAETFVQGSIPGLHETDTFDIITIISGEVYAILESAETLLKAGDTIVQRGTKHSWSNRTNDIVTMTCIHFGAIR
ncbi:hypothetical protein BMF89_16670 [Arthrobacter sp. SRS-W-1-2016]|uniref:cupin domain-containing protein n=1 Tax=Arthrobacter sp. SRS-W-1-2016 TaxID=1930254 RepID=UPI0009913BB7|nr:cupin domain-containing protein [Arthrobacter sp. SRS-W-1-2016]OOP60499.1 hypothetical protein BMF89_16670 [Arthrobacter sp. SRS-W-1-2016]